MSYNIHAVQRQVPIEPVTEYVSVYTWANFLKKMIDSSRYILYTRVDNKTKGISC